jgi:hypothetical protein
MKISSIITEIYKRIFIKKTEPPRIETILEASKKYISKMNEKFMKTIHEDKDNKKWNTNMPTIVYSKKEYQGIAETENNHIEKLWKTRILFETTPRGNICMYYDIYKMGFTYYSDTTSIDYHILNSVAMKYVLLFRCLDFFVDNEVTPNDKCSPLIDIHFTEETKPTKNETTEEKAEKDIMRNKLKDAPFIKYKKTTNDTSQKQPKKQEVKEYIRNRFIYLGKMANYSFLQKPEKNKTPMKFTSKYLDDLEGEDNVQKRVLNYRDFKNITTIM